MLKKLKRYGNNLVLSFTREEEELYEMKEGDMVDLSDMFLKSEKEVKKK